MDLIKLSEKECNIIFDDIGYTGARCVRNMNSLRIVLTYLKSLSETKVDVFLERILENAMYTEMRCKYNTSARRMRECYEVTRERITINFIDFITDGVEYYEVTSNIETARICSLCNVPVCYRPSEGKDGGTPILFDEVGSRKIRKFLESKRFKNYHQVRDFIINKGKSWYKEIGHVNLSCIQDFELLVGIDWRGNRSRLFQ